MANMNEAAKILRAEIDRCRRILALEINKAQWLDAGEVEKAAEAQGETDRLLLGVQPLAERFAAFAEPGMKPLEWVRRNSHLDALYRQLSELVEKVRVLGEQNQNLLRSHIDSLSGELQELHRGREALRGYRSGKKPSQYLDGTL